MDRIADGERSSGRGVVRDGEELVSELGVLADRLVFKSVEKPHVTYADADVSNHMKITRCCCVYILPNRISFSHNRRLRRRNQTN